jgi:hypothetical protein
MNVKQLPVVIIGLILTLTGSVLWTSRVDYSPESKLVELLGNRLKAVDPDEATDLSSACAAAESETGWVLFILNARLIADRTLRTYFETAEQPIGLWVEYDNGLLRLGQGRGAENFEGNAEIPIRIVRNDEDAFIAIGVSDNGTRVVSNVVDKTNQWPGDFTGWSCDSVQIGSESRTLSDGYNCPGCDVRLRYAIGDNSERLDQVLSELSNVREFNVRRWLGAALTFLGLILVVRQLTRIRNHY